MSVLIVGGGLVGSQIARIEVERGAQPVIFDVSPQEESINEIVSLDSARLVRGDVRNLAELLGVISREKIERIIHTAANPMLTVGAQERPYEAIELNVMGTTNVLEAAHKAGIKRVVFTSSSVLYSYMTGSAQPQPPLKEDALPRPTTIYASTKLACEHLGLNYGDSYGLDFVAVRFAAVFGPWSGHGGGGPSNMMKNVIENSVQGRPSEMTRTPPEFVYSKDAARATVLACHAPNLKSKIFNVGMGRVYTAEQLVKIMNDVIPSARITIQEAGGVELLARAIPEPMDLSRSSRELGYEPQYEMEKAVRDHVDWFKQKPRGSI